MHRDNMKWSIQAASISVTSFVILLCHRAWNSSVWLFVRVTVSYCHTVAPQNMGACSSFSLHCLCRADPTWIPFHWHAVLETVVVRYYGSVWPLSVDRMVILPQCASVTEEPHSFVVHHGCSLTHFCLSHPFFRLWLSLPILLIVFQILLSRYLIFCDTHWIFISTIIIFSSRISI